MVADPRRLSGDGHRAELELRKLPAVPRSDRRYRGGFCHYPVSHDSDVRPQRGGPGQRHIRRLGQPGRGRHAIRDAASVLCLRAGLRFLRSRGLAPEHGRRGRDHLSDRDRLLFSHAGCARRQFRRVARKGQDAREKRGHGRLHECAQGSEGLGAVHHLRGQLRHRADRQQRCGALFCRLLRSEPRRGGFRRRLVRPDEPVRPDAWRYLR